MKKSRALLVYGGSFDPPHKSHLKLLRSAVKKLRPAEVRIFTAWHSPLKEKSQTPWRNRAEMIRRCLRETDICSKTKLALDNFEARRGKKTYTCEILRYLRRAYPQSTLQLLMGTDCFAQLRRWKNPREIAKNAAIIVGRRKGAAKIRRPAFMRNCIELPGEFPEVASTELRLEMLLTGKPAAAIPKPAQEYIRRKQLYGLAIHKWLAGNLNKKRWRHSLLVAKLAADLARRHGASPYAAAMAGLLHDAGKYLSKRGLLSYTKRHKLRAANLREITLYQPGLLHSYVSADIAKRIFSIKDTAILNAIAAHTLGSGKMTLLDKILYIADIASEDRDFKAATEIRGTAAKNLDEALFMAAQIKIGHIVARGGWLCPTGLALWNEAIKHNI